MKPTEGGVNLLPFQTLAQDALKRKVRRRHLLSPLLSLGAQYRVASLPPIGVIRVALEHIITKPAKLTVDTATPLRYRGWHLLGFNHGANTLQLLL